MNSDEKSFLLTTQQLAGQEAINTTRLMQLRSWQADITNNSVDRTWILNRINKRSYLQHRISVQQLKIWHTFKTVKNPLQLKTPTKTVDIMSGNWTPDAMAAFLTEQLSPTTTVTYDPYQLRFVFCPSITILPDSSASEYLGFPDEEMRDVQISSFPPVRLFGPTQINVWSNFTMNNIPVSEYLCSIPVVQTYGEHIFFTNYDNSMSSLCLDANIGYVRIILKDEYDELLDYPDGLDWEIVLAMQSTIPEGFAPLEL